MTNTGDSTMAASEAASTNFKQAGPKKKSKRLKTTPAARILVQQKNNYTIQAYFPMPHANMKFNPIASMRFLFKEMMKYDSTITVTNTSDENQIQLAHDVVPTSEEEFKKYFTVTNDTRLVGTPPHVIVGCHMMSNRSVCDIKFDTTTTTKFIDWLKQEKIFIESDLLGITKMTTVGYLTKLHPKLTNCTHLKLLLLSILEDVTINPTHACKLDPSIKTQQTEAMSNGDFLSIAPLEFEIYKTRITCGRDKDKISTDVLGIKCAQDKGRLLKEFFNQSSVSLDLDTRLGTFVPTGTVHLIGTKAYAKLLREHNQFLHTVTTIPIGDFQHETLKLPFSMDANTNIDQTDITEVIMLQLWCLFIERSTTPNKVILITTLGNISAARTWVDDTLPEVYHQHISNQLDVTTLQPKKATSVYSVITSVYRSKQRDPHFE